ncbi:MAG: hypothetical protein OXC61_03090 [Flavobacteriaceae bacterium]|nr:hypothetical protein [Flavobacteriaceae bacterium]
MKEKQHSKLDPKVIEAKAKKSRSLVRVRVTQFASCYAFIGSAVLVIAIAFAGEFGNESWIHQAKDIFLAVLPISAGILGYWFAGRSNSNEVSNRIE